MIRAVSIAVVACLLLIALPADARRVYRCVRGGDVSLATAPEPGSRCTPKDVDDNAVQLPNLWGGSGAVSGTLYQYEGKDGSWYSTRRMKGGVKVLAFTVPAPPGEPAHTGLGEVGRPQLDKYPAQFRAASKATGVDDAWLRAIAHAESGFDANAVSPKGAQGVMQLMPDTSRQYGVADPFSSEQSIRAGARHLQSLMKRYHNDLTLVAAAYNAGIGAVARYGGVPPYAETQAYIAKVQALHLRYRDALTGKAAPTRKASAP